MVSVCMITYGHTNYICDAIEGVLAQNTDFDFELIIANDCSPDNSDEVIVKYLANNPRRNIVKYIRNVSNVGMQKNLAIAVNASSGKYIAICEGDDYWIDSFKLHKQINYMEQNPMISFSFHGAKTLDNYGNYGIHYKHPKFFNKEIVPTKYFLEKAAASFCTASVIIKREVVENLPKWFIEAHIGDYPLMFLALDKGEIGYLEDVMCVYRVNSIQGWSTKNMTIKGRIRNFKKMIQLNTIINEQTFGRYKKHLRLNLFSYILNKFFVTMKSFL